MRFAGKIIGVENVIGVSLILLVLICSTYRLNVLPGLHGDEAWFGLKAVDLQKYRSGSLHGMNNYTGNLQSLFSSWSFSLLGLSVFALRLPGLLSNVLALTLIWLHLKRYVSKKTALLFLLLFAQSILYISYIRIAWEVTSFNFLFFVLYAISLWHICSPKKDFSTAWSYLNLLAGFLGSYNHILFSCLLAATTCGLAFYYLANRKPVFIKGILVSAMGLSNVTVYFLFISDRLNGLHARLGVATLYLILLLIFLLESVLMRYLSMKIKSLDFLKYEAFLSKSLFLFQVACVIGINAFLYFHGLALVQVLSGTVIVKNVFSLEVHPVLSAYLYLAATTLVFYVIYHMLTKVWKKEATNPLPYILSCYFLFFPAYTLKNAPRYYLSLLLLLFIYCAIAWGKTYQKTQISRVLFILLVINLVSSSVLFWESMHPHKGLKVYRFKIGREEHVHSGHFLPMEPLIDSLRYRKASHIKTSESFFIAYPMLFYGELYPELKPFKDTLEVEYDFDSWGMGFRVVGQNRN